jgi:hypothetical protein
MDENLFAHFSGVAAVNFEQESNVITRLTTKWAENFGDNSIVKGVQYTMVLAGSISQLKWRNSLKACRRSKQQHKLVTRSHSHPK